jgi:polyhydroxyalkanoate synthesis regulator phasin
MNDFLVSMNPEVFSITAMIVGLIIEDDYTADELNSIGNWLILVGQVTLTTSAQQQLINNKYQENEGSRIKSDAGNHASKNNPIARNSDVERLYQEIRDLQEEINELKKTYPNG